MGYYTPRTPDGTTIALLASGFAIGMYLPDGLTSRAVLAMLVTLAITAPLVLFYLIDRFEPR